MEIELLTQENYDRLLNIYQTTPELFLQNKGYEGIGRNNLSEEVLQKDKEVNEILKKSVTGFCRFQNFRLSKDGEPQLRFQYEYDSTFVGVGYILLDELLNGFRN